MGDFQHEKAVVRAHYGALERADPGSVTALLAERTIPNWRWRGVHPFHEQHGAEAVAATFWSPYLTAMSRVHRREDIFFAGRNEIDGYRSVWVVSMGHLMGLFDRPWLGIRPTGRIAMLRYAEFNRVENGCIAETALFCDLLHLMWQVGQYPLPPATGALLIQPGPMTHDGLLYGPQDPSRGTATLATINAMLGDMDRKHYTREERMERLQRSWQEDMIWWGPGGIGASYTIPRYRAQHADPFNLAFTEYRFNGHICRLAEGAYGGFFGWPNLTLRNSGGFLGMTAGPGPADMRVVDLYRAADGKLAENWVFIDLLHYLNQQGLDILGRMRSMLEPVNRMDVV